MRTKFDEQLEQLHKEMIAMGGLCENAIASATKALLDGDTTLARSILELSSQIDRRERDIESQCMKLLMQHQPVARDLRTISSALKMVTDMERIGDQSADIADILITANLTVPEDMESFSTMGTAVIRMVTDSIDAFVRQDKAAAKAVIAYDDVVDDCFSQIKTTLMTCVHEAGTDAESALDFLMVAKYFERIGDHAVNIAKWVLFSITGNLEG